MNYDAKQGHTQPQVAIINKSNEQIIRQDHSTPLAVIHEGKQEETIYEESMLMPKPLFINPQITDNNHQFEHRQHPSAVETLNQSSLQSLNLTFHPENSQHLFYKQNELLRLKSEHQSLKNQLIGLNQMISDMIEQKNEVLNQYQKIVIQKKCYKKLLKNLNEDYQSYTSMLQGNYQLKVDQQLQKTSKRHTELKKQVQSMNNELSKPLIKNIYENELNIEKLEKEAFEIQMFIQKQKAVNLKKKEKLVQVQSRIKEKQSAAKKMNYKISQYQQQCDNEQLVSKNTYQSLKEQSETLTTKLSRLKNVNQLNNKKGQLDFHRKMKINKNVQTLLNNIDRQILELDLKINIQATQLQTVEKQKTVCLQKKSIQSKTKKRRGNTFRNFFSKNPHLHPKSVTNDNASNKLSRLDPSLPVRLHMSIQKQPLAHISSPKPFIHYRTVSEGSDSQDRPQLNLRKKRIYTQLQKNMYFKNIENSEHQKLSRIAQFIQKSNISIKKSQQLQKQNEKKSKIKFPQIQKPSISSIDEESIANNDSIIQQASFTQPEEERKVNKKSIEIHNKYIKQLRANKHALNRNNYHQLCNILKRDKLLIEEDCEYSIGDLIYNSKF